MRGFRAPGGVRGFRTPGGPGGGGVSGVSSWNGATGTVTYAPVLVVATFAALAAASSASYVEGQKAMVVGARAPFTLRQSARAARTNMRIAATGKAGYQWVRELARDAYWEVQAAWVIDPANSTGVASDDNDGASSGAPLLTWNEHACRLAQAEIAQATAVSVLGTQQAGDAPTYTYQCRGSGSMTFTGTPAVLFTSTVTSFVAMTFGAAAADDAQLGDTAVPGGSWTAAGVLAKGVIIKRTNGTVISAIALKDLGTTTLRVSQPFNASATTTQPAFVAGDTYQALTLPQILSMKVCDTSSVTTRFVDFDWRVATANAHQGILATRVYFSSWGRLSGGTVTVLQGSVVDSGATSMGNPESLTLSGCAFKGTGATAYSFGTAGTINSEGNIHCLQGCQIALANGTWNGAQVNVYDWTGTGALNGAISTDTGGRAHFLGYLGGKGNTSKLACARQGSQIVATPAIVTGGWFVAASTTDANPIQASATAAAVAIPTDANGNGVFQTA